MTRAITVLAIETSCDETAVSIVRGTGNPPAGGPDVSFAVLGNALLSQAQKHAEFGGVFPALAKREHAGAITPLIEDALKLAGMLTYGHTDTSAHTAAFESLFVHEPGLSEQLLSLLSRIEKPDIDAIAVTAGPGLEPALWVGINTAKALGIMWDLPVLPQNHMEGHFLTSLVENNRITDVAFPVLGLLISGGHTEFVLMKEWLRYERIGHTVDDAVGEAFDKTARLLGLPYPGGPEISRLAEAARSEGLESTFPLPRPMLRTDNLNFSFSGLKTAVLYTVRKIELITDTHKKMLALEFENAVGDVISAKVKKALEDTGAKALLLGGGVAANTHIRRTLEKLIADEFTDVTLYLPNPKETTDNAIMIAQTALLKLLSGHMPQGGDIRASGNLSF